ncbi:RsmB [Desulforapulum autotrophicum HRM2]|uniref:16S rRNA (cytosine(967)-C(5))-methyltransferase n=1 Tax=Desulforapulum autotrophicum (strain ATCC 43914 / DSM 3382 / VKM B-1955 / HRM2) TaxID=177437 RepID=C0QI57_DESAH|nr:16S rRNA (cytosine(967)-C(5))-methyltransferase RsmB [Desulforapulum autotrophicum]ACN15793.1 RsmB [Desulforapulum autotrophicum HRM2]
MVEKRRPIKTEPIKDPRFLALTILIENESSKFTLDKILERYSAQLESLAHRDRALANAIIYGTLRWKEHLDWLITPFSKRPLDQIEPAICYTLRTALYQTVFMDKIPVSAAVNTAVNAAKKLSNTGAAGFVNAVLRKATTRYMDVAMPDSKKDPALFISKSQSIPLWLSRRWIRRFGLDASIALLDAINTIPPITLRANTLRTDRASLATALEPHVETIVPTFHTPDGLSVTRPRTPLHLTTAFKEGLFQVQDEATQIVTTLLAPQPGERILDACAGLGGKTGHMGQIMNNQGKIEAWDLDARKLAVLGNEMKRLGITNVTTKQMDALDIDPAECNTPFDRVLVDAPCTGLGVLRRNPDARWRRTLGDIKRLADLQKRILNNLADLVKPGGILVYAVCSCEPEENEGVIDWFLNNQKSFALVPQSHDLASQDGIFKTYPHPLGMDGFFAATMKKN